ncbi:hypothetical protein POM88_008135 [Heracleum sosnowskyi]|uniref:Uncharacterized protein n=1 Tax=Heracleum sosnowskyi TaxID=360622 RepID=A0AAD8J5U4_9APIA|nr:hypothetical protein POM88_008135 [Heracleum sosnowskyi]
MKWICSMFVIDERMMRAGFFLAPCKATCYQEQAASCSVPFEEDDKDPSIWFPDQTMKRAGFFLAPCKATCYQEQAASCSVPFEEDDKDPSIWFPDQTMKRSILLSRCSTRNTRKLRMHSLWTSGSEVLCYLLRGSLVRQ